LIGAIGCVYLLGYNMSVAVWVGIIALAGVDAETGVIMLLYLDQAYDKWRNEGRMRTIEDLREAITEGAVKRIRPKMMTVMAILVNYLWELVQAPLYVGLESYSTTVLWHCFVASLGDGLMVLLIVAAGWITLRRWDWFEQPAVVGYVVMVTAGLVMAVLIEWL